MWNIQANQFQYMNLIWILIKKKKLKQKLYTHKLLFRDMLVDNIYFTCLEIIPQCSGVTHALILTREMHGYLEVSVKPGWDGKAGWRVGIEQGELFTVEADDACLRPMIFCSTLLSMFKIIHMLQTK